MTGFVAGELQEGGFQGFWNIHFATDAADFFDHVADPAHFGDGGVIDKLGTVCGPVGVDQHFVAVTGKGPDLFRDERHDRVEHGEHLIERPAHDFACFLGGLGVEEGFGKLQVPVAVGIGEGVERVCCVVEAESAEGFVNGLAGFGDFADDPFVGRGGERVARGPARMTEDAVHFGKAGGVPKLRGEVPVALDALGRKLQVAAHGGHGGEREANRVGAEFVNKFKGVEDVAEGLRHLLALLVAHKRVDVDGVEGAVVYGGVLHHHHAGDPEEDDVETGDQDGGREVFLQFVRVLGPAKGADGPEAGGKPGVQNVGVAPDRVDQLCRILAEVVFGKTFTQSFRGRMAVAHLDDARVIERSGQTCKNIRKLSVDGVEVGGRVMAFVALEECLGAQQPH